MGVSAMVVGPNKGHKTTKLAGHKNSQSRTKGMKTKKSAFVHDVIREVCGYRAFFQNALEFQTKNLFFLNHVSFSNAVFMREHFLNYSELSVIWVNPIWENPGF